MSTICLFGTCVVCGLVQYNQGLCRDCNGRVQQGGKREEVSPAPVAQVTKLHIDEEASRSQFEEMAAVAYPGALALGRHPVHGTYKNSNLEKRWRGWLACDQFRAGIKPTPRGE